MFPSISKELLYVANKYGTPLYVYDTERIKKQYNRLVDAFSVPKLKIKYACKALTNISILHYIHSLGADIDTVSIQEIQLALKAGLDVKNIFYTPSGVAFEEIEEALKLGVFTNIDNLPTLEKFGKKYGDTVPVCIRINPNIMAGGNIKISTGHVNAKFGISIHQLDDILRIVKKYKIKVEALHQHTGSDLLDADVFIKVSDIFFDAANHFEYLKALDFGGGFKVPYKEGDIQTNIEELGEKFSSRFSAFCRKYGKELELWFEPGKFIVSQSGYFLTKVNVIKPTTTTTFLQINSGLNHLIRPMFYDSYHHISNLSNPKGKEKIYSVVGYICETDTFAWDRPLPEVREGDILVFHNAGAYGHSMASNYNSRPRPAEVMIKDGKDYLIRKAETTEDMLSNQILVK